MRRIRIQLRYALRALRLIRGAAAGWTMAWFAILTVRGLIPVAIVHLVRELVDGMVAATGRPGLESQVITPLVLLAVAVGAGELLRVAETWVRTRLSDRVTDQITELIHDRALSLDVAFYDSADYHDRLFRVRGQAAGGPLSLLERLGALTQGVVTLLGLTAVLARFGVWLPLTLLASTVPAVWVTLLYSIREHEWRLSATERERRAAYYDALVCSAGTAAEVRVFGVGGFFRDAFRTVRSGLRTERMSLLRHQLSAELALALCGHVIAGGAVAVMVFYATRGQVSLGSVALFYQAFSQGQGVLRTAAEQLRGVYANTLFLGDLFEFLDLQPAITDPAEPVEPPVEVTQGLRLDELGFHYPGSANPVLDRLTLTFPCGRISAIVGPNGAGKSTLLKLICRLYEPTRGSILLDGVDIRRFRLNDYRRLTTTLFQVPVQYAATVDTNIRVGDIDARPDAERVREAARAAGADCFIERLPESYETALIKGAGGTADLSVGEWQRLALARAFLRRAEIIILDEPTSAMDPWAEAEWLERFRKLAAGKTVIIITHRFTTAMKADVIHVMEHGRIVETGSHDNLVTAGGRYAASWSEQIRTWGAGLADRAPNDRVIALQRS